MMGRVLLWLLLSGVLAAVTALRFHDGWLQTDIVALAEQELAAGLDRGTATAVKKANHQFQQSLVWLLALEIPDTGDASARAAPQLATATAQLAQQLASSSAVTDTTYRWGDDRERAALWQFLQPLRGQLLTAADRQQLQQDSPLLAQQQLQFIFSPQSAGIQLDLERDPFFTFQHFLTAENAALSERVSALLDNIPVYQQGNVLFTLVRSQASPLEMRGSIHTPLLQLREQLQQWAAARDMQLLVAGAPLHSEYAAAGAQREIRTIGGFSLLAILLLCLFTFRSLRPLLLCLFAIASGIASGVAAVIVLLGQMHILAFVFGTTVTGLAIDYAFHFICNRLRPGPARDQDIMPGLLLGLLSSCLAFFALALTPFPLLQQMGVFVGFGLLGAWLTVVLLFPALLRIRPRPVDFSRVYPRLPRWSYPLAVTLMVAAGAVGMVVATPANDLRLFYQPPPSLQSDEQQINALLPVRPASSYFLVRGSDENAVLEREAALAARLQGARARGALGGYSALSELLPAESVQQQNHALLDDFYRSSQVRDFYLQLGYPAPEVDRLLEGLRRPLETVAFSQWLSQLPETQRQLWLGCEVAECRSLVRIFGVTADFDGTALADGLSGTSFHNPPATIAAVLEKQRDQLLLLLPLVLLIATAVIALRAGWRGALAIAGLPLAAVSCAFAAAAIFGAGINLFHVAALLLVFGIGVDYAVFGYFSHRQEASYTLLAIALAGVTTLLGFGLLALSQTPAIADFGFTLAVGTVATLVLAALIFSSGIFGGNR
ncbi:MMPL family transporter [Microbulbifer bruguierae]|uniref:MMPL family transporter n=1 Tax=Microbulbifer bruguierae TaxID=3029061 RepID=A0ABY8NA22_9GAMM|nr:MMPL family transporter [Microbulbifer bruguierae]WGL15274.1 MMPL family transporter [Microbulbifer bruguierae]